MEEDCYKGRLVERHGLEIIIPSQNDRELVHRVIYDELVVGEIRPTSKVQFIEIIDNFVQGGAEGIVLGCTEIGLLVRQEDVEVRVFDTTFIHATVAAEYALGEYVPKG